MGSSEYVGDGMELWDYRSGNLMNYWSSEAEALRDLKKWMLDQPEVDWTEMGLGRTDLTGEVLEGEELIRRVMESD